ncbi:50S ribosomal protein L3 [candidate division WWE3 bacterium]|uniref:50S ribosomal protein L3 n=1 Tax=candidate division WWE3 bacterium TaxID=2053526 RepID=A0A955LLK5_UNCKA|nr:50S ribosomal protein L3 [candidate division WWE3 bacterium]
MEKVSANKIEMTQIFNDDGTVVPVTRVRVADKPSPLTKGSVVDVTGTSKGKGFAGVVKRYSFAGGPKTHGQSDRHRAPGSIGAGTDPGRVWKGQKMPGRMGGVTVTVRNLTVVDVKENEVYLKGAVPGTRNAKLTLSVHEVKEESQSNEG